MAVTINGIIHCKNLRMINLVLRGGKMRVRLFASWFVVSFIVQGCTAPPVSTLENHIQESATPTIAAATPTVPPTAIPSATADTTATSSIAITNTPLPTPEPVNTVQPACFTTLPTLPDTKTYPGKVIYSAYLNFENIKNSYSPATFFDLKTRQTMPMHPDKIHAIEVSPDGSKYAVVDAADKKVKIFSANGQSIRTLPAGEYPYTIDHWLNNEQIALVILQPWGENYYKYPIDELIFNPFTGEQKLMVSEQYPDIDQADARRLWEGVSTTKYDPLLTRVVYPAGIINQDYLGRSGIGYILWDLEKQIKLVEIVTRGDLVTPKWAPDGSRFVINDDYGDGEFYAVSRDGVVTQLSHLNPDLAAESAGRRYLSDRYSWSPDGRYLAFWLESVQNSAIRGAFAVLDTGTGQVTDTCIPAGFIEKGIPSLPVMYVPVWSPDGKSLVTVANRQEDGSYQSILIDLEGKFAAPFGKDIFPVGWLVDGGD
jgi:WD40 repeat protein